MSATRPMRMHLTSMGLALGTILTFLTASVHGDPLDLAVDGIGVGSVQRGAVQANPQQVAISVLGNQVAFTFTTRIKNVGTDPIRWGYPVRELSSADAQILMALGINAGPSTPWVDQNAGTQYLLGNPLTPVTNRTGYSGISEGVNNHPHYQILPTAADPNSPVVIPPPGPARDALLEHLDEQENFYGPHQHVQLYVLKQRGGAGNPLELIGHSGLKHGFQTDPLALPVNGQLSLDPNTHFLMPGEQDTYSNNSNMDRDFLGPVNEIDPITFKVADHLHFADNMAPYATENGFNVYNRAYGEKDETDPFEFRLVAPVTELDDRRIDPNDPTATRWYFAASYFVYDPNRFGPGMGGRELNTENNTSYRRFDPNFNGIRFSPVWIGDSVPGSAIGAPLFLEPLGDESVEHLPEPSTLVLLGVGMAVLAVRGLRPGKRAARNAS